MSLRAPIMSLLIMLKIDASAFPLYKSGAIGHNTCANKVDDKTNLYKNTQRQ